MRPTRLVAAALLALSALAGAAQALERFPPPDFETQYRQPVLTFQTRSTEARQWADAGLLVAAMLAGAWLLLARRSRRGMVVLGLASLAWFGFYRMGCICPVGSVQNVCAALLDPARGVPLVVVVLFMAPLVFALFAGRVFCGGVCPLGAIQDVFLFRPVRTPRFIDESLGLLRYLVLGAVVYVVATESFFPLCRFDPFVNLFRFGGRLSTLAWGASMLVLAMFLGRPFCRYVCPYGGLLAILSRWTGRGVGVTPDVCIKCSLCDGACPFGAILRPADEYRAPLRARLAAWLGGAAGTAALAAGGYAASGGRAASAMLGGWFGLVIGVKLVSLCYRGARPEYRVNQAECLSCGRCYMACPMERKRRRERGAAREGGQERIGTDGSR